MPARESEPSRTPPSPRPPSAQPSRPMEPPPQPEPNRQHAKRVPRPNRAKGTWYVSFVPKDRQVRPYRMTESFRNEQDAKEFAKARLTDGCSHVAAGTLNPLMPKRTIASAQIFDWLDPDNIDD
jgi:hypothetical protein